MSEEPVDYGTITVLVTVERAGKVIFQDSRSAPRKADRGGQAETLANHAAVKAGESYAWPENDGETDPMRLRR